MKSSGLLALRGDTCIFHVSFIFVNALHLSPQDSFVRGESIFTIDFFSLSSVSSSQICASNRARHLVDEIIEGARKCWIIRLRCSQLFSSPLKACRDAAMLVRDRTRSYEMNVYSPIHGRIGNPESLRKSTNFHRETRILSHRDQRHPRRNLYLTPIKYVSSNGVSNNRRNTDR